ncbi:fez family zinc finger protein 1 [Oreochromis niloticus]|uniref:fez family zinc finger protein 1 n=1 Tax=Oreochromis niloticus TaxID=8128 RepID=UPI00039431BB|nr:fez family zinc finger protein 1 [Oreochromis niloticus]CAI5648234.1 unnamed protein product [Mustela putorius furo]
MIVCCVSGCKKRYIRSKKLKFYKIPSRGHRRRLWLRAIQEANGSTARLTENDRVCGAHFISGEASMERDKPDFVPSVFTCTQKNQSPKKKVKWFYGRRKRHRRKARGRREENAAPIRAESSVNPEPSVLTGTESELSEEMQTPATPSVPKEGETVAKVSETEAETQIIQTQTINLNKTSPSFKGLPDTLKLDKRRPIVLLKPLVASEGGYRCELCSQTFTDIPQLVKHKRLHEEQRSFVCENCGKSFISQADFSEHHAVHRDEPLFPCNMCDRSFTTIHQLKRHKLLHVKDGRKCLRCGTLFCQRHNHILFLPQTEFKTESEPEDSSSRSETENELEPSQMTEIPGNTQSSRTVTPPLSTSAPTAAPTPPNPGFLSKPPPLATFSRLPEIPPPVLLRPCPVPRRLYPEVRHSENPGTSFHHDFFTQNTELPSSLKIFSPQYLTSAFLEVKRNYQYILSKPKKCRVKNPVKKEQSEAPIISPEEHTQPEKKERIAYDLEMVL